MRTEAQKLQEIIRKFWKAHHAIPYAISSCYVNVGAFRLSLAHEQLRMTTCRYKAVIAMMLKPAAESGHV